MDAEEKSGEDDIVVVLEEFAEKGVRVSSAKTPKYLARFK
ncbi:hypothetical protein A2U01_0119074, partial [Trifolium medium]|nr:hypothetical protein [Trifolium medium]